MGKRESQWKAFNKPHTKISERTLEFLQTRKRSKVSCSPLSDSKMEKAYARPRQLAFCKSVNIHLTPLLTHVETIKRKGNYRASEISRSQTLIYTHIYMYL